MARSVGKGKQQAVASFVQLLAGGQIQLPALGMSGADLVAEVLVHPDASCSRQVSCVTCSEPLRMPRSTSGRARPTSNRQLLLLRAHA